MAARAGCDRGDDAVGQNPVEVFHIAEGDAQGWGAIAHGGQVMAEAHPVAVIGEDIGAGRVGVPFHLQGAAPDQGAGHVFFQAAALGAFFINAILGVLAAPEVLHVGQAALVMTVHAVEIRIDHLHTRGAAMVGDNVTDVESLCAIHVGDQTAEPRHRRLIRISRFDGLVDAAQIVHVAVFPEDFEFRVQRG